MNLNRQYCCAKCDQKECDNRYDKIPKGVSHQYQISGVPIQIVDASSRCPDYKEPID